MASELMIIEERERREIATALHDSIGQILAFSSIELGNALSKADKKSVKSLKKVRLNIEKAITETRKLTYDLSPAVLYSFGLNPAIEHLSEQFSVDHNFACSFETDNKPINISTEVELFLYRAVRELLVNIAKHAKAKKAAIKTRLSDNNLEISVSDDGQGFDLFSVNVIKGEFNSIGLLSIKERLTHIGGSLKIYSMPGKGTEIRILTPIEEQNLNKEIK
jgi:signal transduction histidine kinase